ncbi:MULTISPECIES: hypothetical protein [Actinomadura]|uniref:hypothetical protein n=1 Tax=Actinomadura TaxID=1988 RepID=UPI001376CEA9|nr:hypothetical protein [Actinomadura madurae]
MTEVLTWSNERVHALELDHPRRRDTLRRHPAGAANDRAGSYPIGATQNSCHHGAHSTT